MKFAQAIAAASTGTTSNSPSGRDSAAERVADRMIAADRDNQRSAVDDPARGGRSPGNFASVSTPGIATSPTSVIVTPTRW